MRRIQVVALACVVALLAAGPTPGQDPSSEPPEPEARLSLAEVLRTALRNNLDLVSQRKDPQIADRNVTIQDAGFDAAIAAGPTFRGSKSEPQDIFQVAGRSKSYSVGAQLEDRLKFGADYTVGFESEKATGSAAFYDPSYTSSLSFTFNLPLLRGFGKEVTTELLILAKADAEISREELNLQAETTLEAVEAAYWNVLAAQKASGVAKESLSLAQNLLSLNKKKVEVGTLAPIEITQADAGVASREEAVISTETLVLNTEDELRRLMGVPQSDPLWNERIIPTEKPEAEPRTTDVNASLTKALAERPEMARARQRLSAAQVSESAAENRSKPGLDLRFGATPYGNNLLRVDSTGFVTAGYGESVTEIPKLNNYNWNMSLLFSIPIGNRAANAAKEIATLDREKAEVELANQEQNIRVEVRTAVRNVDSGAKRVAAARSNVTLQQKKLEAEQKKFDNGMSTSFEVLTFQNDLLNAQVALIQAMTDYNKSLATAERVQGTLLEARGLRLEP